MNRKKIVLITGTRSGIGRETAIFLANKGFIVYAGSRTPQHLDDIKAKNLIPIELDITDINSIKKAIIQIKKEHQHIDILINNAGYGLFSTVEEGTDEEIFQQFDVNVFGVIKTIREVLHS